MILQSRFSADGCWSPEGKEEEEGDAHKPFRLKLTHAEHTLAHLTIQSLIFDIPHCLDIAHQLIGATVQSEEEWLSFNPPPDALCCLSTHHCVVRLDHFHPAHVEATGTHTHLPILHAYKNQIK